MPSASENSFLKSPGISALPNSKQKIRHEPPPITKLKAWSPSDLSEHEDSQQHNTEGDDSLQYSDHSKAKNSVAEGQNIEDDNYSDHYSDEDDYTSGTPVQRQENKVQPANGQSNRTSATPIYPEISSAKVKDPPRKSSKENIELPSQASNPSETPSKQVTKGQAYGTRIPPLVPHPSQSDPSSQSNDNAGRKNLSKMHSAQSSASEHGDHGSNSKGIKIMKRQKIPSDIPPLTQGRETVLNPSLSKSSLHPREEKRSDQARASSASLAVGKKKWRCTNKNCVHINYEEDNYCSNCGSIRRSNPSMISATRKS